MSGVKSFEGFINGRKAKFKTMTDATKNQAGRARSDYNDSIKQGGEHFVLNLIKSSINLADINSGICDAVRLDIKEKIKFITIVRNGAVQTLHREDIKNGKRIS